MGSYSFILYFFLHIWIFLSLGLKDELEAELEELEGAELEEQLLQPFTTAPTAPIHVPEGKLPARPTPQKNSEEDELAALQAEMALWRLFFFHVYNHVPKKWKRLEKGKGKGKEKEKKKIENLYWLMVVYLSIECW